MDPLHRSGAAPGRFPQGADPARRFSLALLLVGAALAAACETDAGQENGGENFVSGDFSFTVRSASASANPTADGSLDLSYVDVQLGDIDMGQFCGAGEGAASGVVTAASISVDDSARGIPLTPGTYDLRATQGPISRVLVFRTGAADEIEYLAESQAGTITIEELAGGRVRGRFEAVMVHMVTGAQGTLNGTFNAPFCTDPAM